MDELHLECSPTEGGKWTGLVEVTVFDEQHSNHRIKTSLSGHSMVFCGELRQADTIVLIVNAQSNKIDDKWVISATTDTVVLPRANLPISGLSKVVELCSGMGCLGIGLKHAGFEIQLRNDCNARMLKLAKTISNEPVLHGSLNDDRVLALACQQAPDARVLTSGIACQPYSRLGDGRAQADERSATLPGTLRFGFLGRFAIIILECVPEALECSWVQSLLKKFAAITGYHISQGELRLQDIWPARRHRWWCILTHPAIGAIPWNPFPQVHPTPVVAHVLDCFKSCNDFELKNLMLDLYELGRFGSVGFESNEVPWGGKMATALHSCGNQLGSCPCGCRTHPFTESRLAIKGVCMACSSASRDTPFVAQLCTQVTDTSILMSSPC